MNESWHTYVLQENRAVLHENRALIYLSVSHVADVDEACHTYEWVMSHIWMSHVTHMNESCHTYEW